MEAIVVSRSIVCWLVIANKSRHNMSLPAKIGTWGGNGGQPRDIKRKPMRLTDITVRSDDEHINSIEFTYIDRDGVLHDEGPWGGYGGNLKPPVKLRSSEYVNEISGTFGPWGDIPAVITSLKFVTSKGAQYSYGNADGGSTSFHIPLEEGQICGFYCRAGDLLDAIGVYILV